MIADVLPTQDAIRCGDLLSRLARHFSTPLIFTGGLATRWHALNNNHPIDAQPLNDVDIVVEQVSQLPPTLDTEFLISHFHPTRGGGRILLQLVDETSRMRIDIFTPSSPSLMTRAQAADVAGLSCIVVSAEDIAAKLLSVLCKVIKGESVEPKYYEKFELLCRFVDFNVMKRIWRDYRKEEHPSDLEAAMYAVRSTIEASPALLQAEPYGGDPNTVCEWCEVNDAASRFPRSSRTQIFDILGYL